MSNGALTGQDYIHALRLSEAFMQAVSGKIMSDPALQQKADTAITEAEEESLQQQSMQVAEETMRVGRPLLNQVQSGTLDVASAQMQIAEAVGPKTLQLMNLSAEFTSRVLSDAEMADLMPKDPGAKDLFLKAGANNLAWVAGLAAGK